MKVVVGLGNPGPRYETTRHNVGFLAVDRLVDELRARPAPDAYQGEIQAATLPGGEKLLLVKPQTFMNCSGQCVGPLVKFYKCAPSDLVVIHDEVDLKPEVIRIKTGGGTGGHNGLKSIDSHLGAGATGYHRIRIGIGRPGAERPGMDTADHVLEQFSDRELERVDLLLDWVVKATLRILDGDVLGAMNEYNNQALPAAR